MDRRILVGYDGSPLAKRALAYACEAHTDAAITVMFVIDPVESVIYAEASGPNAARDWVEAAETDAAEACEEAETEAAAADVDIRTVTAFGSPAREILRYARSNEIDQIVVGSHGRSGLKKLVFGSVAEAVTRGSPVPVTVVR